MRLIIAGSRRIPRETALKIIEEAVQTLPEISQVVSGCATGPDQAGEVWARRKGISCQRFKPNWSALGEKAGPLRNSEMATYASAEPGGHLLLIWDGHSQGSMDMKRRAKRAGLTIVERFAEPTHR